LKLNAKFESGSSDLSFNSKVPDAFIMGFIGSLLGFIGSSTPPYLVVCVVESISKLLTIPERNGAS